MRRSVRTVLLAIAVPWITARAAAQDRARPELLVRSDDIGMNHSVNYAGVIARLGHSSMRRPQ